ncbi:MAG TPA: HWE histidine kinase domain-containing protein, partial [Phenylobacterium sp.]
TQTTSAANVLRKGAPANLFKDQIVLIGLTSAGAADLVSTPRARAVNGVYVQAQAVDAVLRGSGLQRPAWTALMEWTLGLGLVLAAWLGIPRVPMARAAGIAAGAGVAAIGGSWLAFANNLLVDPMPMLAPGAATCAVMVVLLYTEGRRTQARLRAVLEAERRRAEEHQQLLINELNHRVKNTLATVQSIAVQTLRPGRGPVEAREAFVSRLIALSTAHNVLTAERWESADLADIAQMAAAPFNEPSGAHVQVEGPRLRLKPAHALSIAMALHELGTNAVKFGALSVPGGVVRLAWAEGPGEEEVRIVWQESGGPRVETPVRKGFGTRLIQEALARELRGQVRVAHDPAGLRCEIAFRRDLED